MRNTDKTARRDVRAAFVALGIIVLIACGIRVWWVNTQAYAYPYTEEHHAMGEWVELDGAFIDSATEETDGYAIRVIDAEIMSYREYAERYGIEGTEVPDDEALDAQSILCLTIEMRNDNEEEGGSIFLGEAKLIPNGLPTTYNYSGSVWAVSNSNMGAASLYIGVLAGTSTVQYIPYATGASGDTPADGERYTTDLPEASGYTLVVSNAPVRHIIDITVNGK